MRLAAPLLLLCGSLAAAPLELSDVAIAVVTSSAVSGERLPQIARGWASAARARGVALVAISDDADPCATPNGTELVPGCALPAVARCARGHDALPCKTAAAFVARALERELSRALGDEAEHFPPPRLSSGSSRSARSARRRGGTRA